MVTAKEEFIVDATGRKKAVILPIKEYERLLEDMHDLGMIINRCDEPGSPLNEVEGRLREHGLLSDRD